jgi:hypothetical protein
MQTLSVGMWVLSRSRLEPNDTWLDEYFDSSEAKLTGFSLRVRLGFWSWVRLEGPLHEGWYVSSGDDLAVVYLCVSLGRDAHQYADLSTSRGVLIILLLLLLPLLLPVLLL